MDEKKNAWKTALLNRLQRADIEFDSNISPDDALELFCRSVAHGLKERWDSESFIEKAQSGFPSGVLLLKDMEGIKIEGGSSELNNDDNEGARYPVLIMSRTPHDEAHSLYIVMQDKKALRSFQMALADAALAIMYPEDTYDVHVGGNGESKAQTDRFIELLRALKEGLQQTKDTPKSDEQG